MTFDQKLLMAGIIAACLFVLTLSMALAAELRIPKLRTGSPSHYLAKRGEVEDQRGLGEMSVGNSRVVPGERTPMHQFQLLR